MPQDATAHSGVKTETLFKPTELSSVWPTFFVAAVILDVLAGVIIGVSARNPYSSFTQVQMIENWMMIAAIPSIIVALLFSDISFSVVGNGKTQKKMAEVRALMQKRFPDIRHLDVMAYRPLKANGAPDNSRIVADAIAYDGHHLLIVEHGVLAIIGKKDLRAWRAGQASWNHVTAFSRDPAHHLQANDHNARQRYLAGHNSGVFLDVVDIDKSTWHFTCDIQKITGKWEEILRQIQEGRLPLD